MSKIKRILMAIKQFGFSDTDFDMLVEQMYKLVAVAPKMTSTARVLDPRYSQHVSPVRRNTAKQSEKLKEQRCHLPSR